MDGVKLKFGDPESIAIARKAEYEATEAGIEEKLSKKDLFCPDCGEELQIARIDHKKQRVYWERATYSCECDVETDFEGNMI